MGTLRSARRRRRQIHIGASDASLTGAAGLLAVADLAERVGLLDSLDAAVAGFKVRDRGCSAGEFLVSMACAQLAGADHLVGLDHRRADRVSDGFWAHATPASTTATGLARRIDEHDWQAITAATAAVTRRALKMTAPTVRARLAGPPTIDIDATDIEVYGRKKQAVTYNYLGQRSGRVHAATWAQAGLLTAMRVTDSRTTAYLPAPELVEQAMTWLDDAGVEWNPQQRPRVRADIGYCSKDVAWRIVAAGADFAIGVQRQPKIWRLLDQIDDTSWIPAIGMDRAEVAAIDYPYRGWPPRTRLLIRRVRHVAADIGADPRARRRRTLAPGQLALALDGLVDHVFSYSFILTNLDITTRAGAAEIEAWHRHRTDIEELFKQAKHGAALRHLPSGDPRVNNAWVHTAFLAVALVSWLNLLLDQPHRIGVTRWRRELLHTAARQIHHGGQTTLRCAPGSLLPAVLARIRGLPAR